MSGISDVPNHISQLVAQLGDRDAVVRTESRVKLVQLGGYDVTRALVRALIDPRPHVRWEAAKALQAIADPVSAPAMMHALDDDDEDVRWVAAEGLVALKTVGLLTTLSGLIKRACSVGFCKSAHHVLRQNTAHLKVIAPVCDALESLDCAVMVPPTAFQALTALSHFPDSK